MHTRNLVAVAAALLAAQAHAATTVYTDEASFLAALQPGYGYNTFTANIAPQSAPSYSYASAGFVYTFTGAPTRTANGTFRNGQIVSTNYQNASLRIDFNTPVQAFGGKFFGADDDGIQQPSTVQLTLSDVTMVSIASGNRSDAFRGFISDTPILFLTMASVPSRLNAVDDFIVGTPIPVVPEPQTYALMLAGLAAVGWCARRQRARRSEG